MMAAKYLVPWPALLVVVYPWCVHVTAGQPLSFEAAAPPATCLHVPRREVLQGSSVSVPCAGGDHDSGGHIRWYKEGKPVLPAPQGHVALNGSSLRLTQVVAADSGCYQCLRENGRWSSYALEVIGPMSPPEITDSDGNSVGSKLGSLVQGEALELFCSPPQEFPSARIRWQLQDQWGPSSSSAVGTTVLVSGTGSLLRIESLDRRHHGLKLRCTASRPVAGAASAAVTLDVFLAPVQALLVRRGPLVAGVTAELECVAWGSRPEPTLRWTLGGRPMASAFSHWDGRNVSTATVTLRPAPADHGRRLVCAASNSKTPAVPPVQDSRRLDVHYPPEVQLETCNAATGWACLRCRVDANPPPLRLTWTRDGEPMRDVPPLSTVLRWRQRQGRLEHYACAAENPLGAASSRPVGLILLEKQGKATMSTALTAALLLLLALLLMLVAFLCILAWNRRRLWLRGRRGRTRGRQSSEVLRAASYSGPSVSFERAQGQKPA